MTAKFNAEKIEEIISKADLSEKVELLTGAGRCALNGNERLGVPVAHTSDGPHGLRGGNFFNVVPGVQLPSAIAMGATFDVELLHQVGNLLADEAVAKNKHIILAPTVCIQRSPLIGRGFEAFGEDPVLSGTLGGHYVKGIQDKNIAATIKHYAAHDQSIMSIEDNIVATERTLRELHLLPFQIASKICMPWAYMTAYNKINGLHASEDPWLIKKVLQEEWGFDGLVMSDWWGTYSTSEAMNAGLDLEMPGPTVWRGKTLNWAVESRKVSKARIDEALRRFLTIIAKTQSDRPPKKNGNNDTPEGRALTRKVATDSIVLLKNEREVLPLKPENKTKYGLIGDHWKNPATGGGGSSEATPYYVSRPYDAMLERLGAQNVDYEVGTYSHRFSPLLTTELAQPKNGKSGLFVELFTDNPDDNSTSEVVWSAETDKSLCQFTDSLPTHVPETHFIRVQTIFTAPETMKYCFGLSCLGKAIMRIDGEQVIDLWTDQPEKIGTTPVFSAFSAERFYHLSVEKGRRYEITIIMCNVFSSTVVGISPAGGVRLGGYEVIDEDKAISDAVALAKQVEVPIVMTGLSSDYEMESFDRLDLDLPLRTNELIQRVAEANPNAVIVLQSGLPVTMPWASQANTIVHAWYGGQETGNALADILCGEVNPSGRLSITFPKRLEDTPSFLNYGKSDWNVVYGEGVFVGYRYYEKLQNLPLFYFGHGLSYTKFCYSNLVVPKIFEADPSHVITVSVDVSNTGDYSGADVVQVYVADLQASVQRPKKELKGFQKVSLETSEKKTVYIELGRSALSFWSEEDSKWKAEAGRFKVIISKSADPADEILEAEFELLKTFTWSGL